MCMMNQASLFVIIPISLLLALSFFVLVTARKVEGNALKTFGHVVVSLLWLAAFILLLGIFQRPAYNRMSFRGQMYQKTKMGDNMAAMMQREQVNLPVDAATSANPKAKQDRSCGNKGIIFKTK